ncbi:MAG: helix-turn-helix domain-containing protein [Clostridia bacterium]|nr:helix-turn-helix domain-containing protein [Clostridia bacterium]
MLLNVCDTLQYDEAMFRTEPWMETCLGIKRNDLKMFSFIYNHTLSRDTVVDIKQDYLSNIMGCSRKTISNALNRLVEKGWLCRVDKDYTLYTGYVLNYSEIVAKFPSLVRGMVEHLLPSVKNLIKFSNGERVYHNSEKVTPSQVKHNEKVTPSHNNIYINNNIYSCISSNTKNKNINNNIYNSTMPRCKFSVEDNPSQRTLQDLSIEELQELQKDIQRVLTEKQENTQKDEIVTENQPFVTEIPDLQTENSEFITETDLSIPDCCVTEEKCPLEYVEYCQSLLVEYLEDRRTGVEVLAQTNLFGCTLPKSIKRTKATVADIYRLIEDMFPHTQEGVVSEINQLLRMLVTSCLERNHKPSYNSWVLNLGHLMEYCQGDLSVAKLEITQQLAGEQDLPLAKYKVGSTYLKFNLGKHLDVPDVYNAIVDERCDPTKGPKYEETNTWLKKYLKMRVGKDHINFDLDGWHDLIDHLFVYSEGNIDVAAETIRIQTLRSATTTVPYGATGLSKTEFEKREQLKYTSRYPQRGFTDTLAGTTHPKACADMTPEEYQEFVDTDLAHNNDGSLMKF